MGRLPFAFATAALALAVLAGPAAADGLYFYEGFGVSHYRDEIARYVGDDGVNIRAGIGWRSGHIAMEVYARGEITDLVAADAGGERPGGGYVPSGLDDGMTIIGADLKVIQPLSRHWSAYARAGLSKMIAGEDYAGRGVGATAGIQVAGKVPALGFLFSPLFFCDCGPKVHSALWLETGTSFHRLHSDYGPAIDVRIDGWTLGFSVGQDF